MKKIKIAKGTKRPALQGWRQAKGLSKSEAEIWIANGGSVGAALGALELVIDVDPRNGGELSRLRKLENYYPTVVTPGGWHIWMRLPADFGAVRHTIPGWHGFEFKTLGRQVLIPPSPGYFVDLASPGHPAQLAPDWILKLIAEVPKNFTDPKETPAIGDAELSELLKQLDPSDFRSNDIWFKLMCACHEITGGAGEEAFIAWSKSDVPYESMTRENRERWGSLKAGQSGNTSEGALYAILSEHGAGVAAIASTDFADVVDNSDIIIEKSPMEKLSEEFFCVDANGQVFVYAERADPEMNQIKLVRYTRHNFIELCKMVRHLGRIEMGKKTIELSEAWMDYYTKKTTYSGISFQPETSGRMTPDGKLNLWRGFAVTPSPEGSWDRLKELLAETLCDGDSAFYEYTINWMARGVQQPWEPGQVALVFQGAKGTGKSTLGRAFVRLFGQHGLHITSSTLLVGRFNAHLRDNCVLFADEVSWKGNKNGEGILKGLITEPIITYEGKGTPAEAGRNCLNIILSSNENWVVPAGLDNERRYAVTRVRDTQQPIKYWTLLQEELLEGGYGAMLYELQNRDISKFNVFKVPQTRALLEQKIRSMATIEQWLYDLVDSGEYEKLYLDEELPDFILAANAVQQSLRDFYILHNVRSRLDVPAILGRFLKNTIGAKRVELRRTLRTEYGRYGYEVPSLTRARSMLEKITGEVQ